jgi:hypothetical protein
MHDQQNCGVQDLRARHKWPQPGETGVVRQWTSVQISRTHQGKGVNVGDRQGTITLGTSPSYHLAGDFEAVHIFGKGHLTPIFCSSAIAKI